MSHSHVIQACCPLAQHLRITLGTRKRCFGAFKLWNRQTRDTARVMVCLHSSAVQVQKGASATVHLQLLYPISSWSPEGTAQGQPMHCLNLGVQEGGIVHCMPAASSPFGRALLSGHNHLFGTLSLHLQLLGPSARLCSEVTKILLQGAAQMWSPFGAMEAQYRDSPRGSDHPSTPASDATAGRRSLDMHSTASEGSEGTAEESGTGWP